MATLIALGPGDPDLIPLASWRALEAAGPVALLDDEPLAEWLGAHGIALDADAPVAAASGERLRRLLAARAWDETVPAGAALQSLVLADAMLALQRLTERLRRDCPWDREQTVGTIVPHTVEEAYEVAEAAGAGTGAKLLDELGDLLFQTFFLALLCEEDGAGDLAGVAAGITAKLIRRHPHVFGEREAETAGAVRQNWEQIKRDQEGRSGIFHDVPGVLPALLHARKVQRRASAVGFDWDTWDGAWPGLADELRELREALDSAPAAAGRARAGRRGGARAGRPALRRDERRPPCQRRSRAGAAGRRGPLPRAGRDGRAAGRRGGRGAGPASTSRRRTPGTGGRRLRCRTRRTGPGPSGARPQAEPSERQTGVRPRTRAFTPL